MTTNTTTAATSQQQAILSQQTPLQQTVPSQQTAPSQSHILLEIEELTALHDIFTAQERVNWAAYDRARLKIVSHVRAMRAHVHYHVDL